MWVPAFRSVDRRTDTLSMLNRHGLLAPGNLRREPAQTEGCGSKVKGRLS